MNETYLDETLAGETLCPRCGNEAEWRYLAGLRDTVEISCPDCGITDLDRSDFQVIESGILNSE